MSARSSQEHEVRVQICPNGTEVGSLKNSHSWPVCLKIILVPTQIPHKHTFKKKNVQLPGVSKGYCLKVFVYLKTSKKHPLCNPWWKSFSSPWSNQPGGTLSFILKSHGTLSFGISFSIHLLRDPKHNVSFSGEEQRSRQARIQLTSSLPCFTQVGVPFQMGLIAEYGSWLRRPPKVFNSWLGRDL